jgi:hypothetical protein
MIIEERNNVISALSAIITMFWISVAVVCYIEFVLYNLPVGVVALGYVLGGAISLVILPILVIVPWRFLGSVDN